MIELSDALETFAGHRRILVASDFDGTLSDLVDRPDDARPVEGATEVLVSLARAPYVHVVLVSGRRLDDLERRFGGPLPGVTMIGEHGSIRSDSERLPHPEVERLVGGLESLASGFEGSQVEAKLTSVTLHFRNVATADQEAVADQAAAYLRDATSDLTPRPRVEVGRGVVEVPLSSVTKSDAVLDAQGTCGADAVIYFGDDISDESVFEGLRSHDVGVKVGSAPSAARYRLAEPRHVVSALEQLVYLRD